MARKVICRGDSRQVVLCPKAIAKARWITYLHDHCGMSYEKIALHIERRQAQKEGRKPKSRAWITGMTKKTCQRHREWYAEFRAAQLNGGFKPTREMSWFLIERRAAA